MNQKQFQQMLVDLMNKGLCIGMFMESDDLWFDMNTGMKSHLHIKYDEPMQQVQYRGRYGVTGVIRDMDELLWAVRHCGYGRGFCNATWGKIL